MNRYLIWSVVLHISILLGGASVAPLGRLWDTGRDTSVIISVGLVDTPGAPKRGPAPIVPVPAPAQDAEIGIKPVPDMTKEKVKDKPKPEPKKPDPKQEAAKRAEADARRKADSIKSAQLAQAGGTTGTISEGEGGEGDVWGVETGPTVNPYHRRGFAAIRSNWRNPAVGPAPRKCVVKFRVKRTGELVEIDLEESSGSEFFDRSAVRAVQMTENWEQFPQFWKENEQIIHLEFEYRP